MCSSSAMKKNDINKISSKHLDQSLSIIYFFSVFKALCAVCGTAG